MAKIDINPASRGVDTISILCSFGIICGLIVTVLGIKFKWFKHRLTFEQVPRNNKQNELSSQYKQSSSIQGVFRRKFDEENEIIRPKSLPPVRVRKSSKVQPMIRPASHKISEDYNDDNSTNKIAVELKEENAKHKFESGSLKPTTNHQNKKQMSSKAEKMDGNLPKVHNTQITSNELDDVKNIKKRTKKRAKLSESEMITSIQNENKENRNQNKNNNLTEIDTSERVNVTFEKLKEETDKELKNTDVAKRRPTGIIKPNIEDKKEKEKVVTFEEPTTNNNDDDDEYGESILSQRRPTQFNSPNKEELNKIAIGNSSSGMIKLDGFSDNEEELKVKEIKRPTPKTRTQEISSQEAIILATNLAEMNPDDSWSAIQRHRNLTQELTKQHQATKNSNNKIKNGNNEYRNPLATTQSKPKTMRDMKKSKEKSNEVINFANSEDTEA